MSAEQITVIVGAALGAGGLGAVLSYLIARRRASGQVGTTDADRLWQQNDKLIDTLRADNGDLRERLTLTDQRIFALDADNRECLKRADVFEARMKAAEKILQAKAEVAAAKVSVAEGQLEVAEKQQEITTLKAEAKKANGGGS